MGVTAMRAGQEEGYESTLLITDSDSISRMPQKVWQDSDLMLSAEDDVFLRRGSSAGRTIGRLDTAHQRRVSELGFLEDDWDSYGSCRISQAAITQALLLLGVGVVPPLLGIVPTSEGGVAFEWRYECGDITVEIMGEEEVDLIYHLPSLQEQCERVKVGDLVGLLNELIFDLENGQG